MSNPPVEMTFQLNTISKTTTQGQRRKQQLNLGFWNNYYNLYLHDLNVK